MPDTSEITGVGESVADRLRQQGIETVEELADADADDISVPTGNIETLIQRARQETISSKSANDLLSEYENTTYLSTGVEMLDDVLDGGWESGMIAMVYGKSGRGKSQVAFSTLTEASSEGSVAYIQTEMQSKSIAQRIQNLSSEGSDLDNISIYEAYSVEDQFSTYDSVREDHDNLEAIVIDSFTAQFRMTDEYDDRSTLSARSSAIGRHLRKLGKIARTYDIPILLTGQVYPSPEAYGKGDNLWGGEKLKHFVSYFLRMSSGQGELVEASLENHPGKSEESVLLNISNNGIEGVQG
jgi:RecA/RadA recombinase